MTTHRPDRPDMAARVRVLGLTLLAAASVLTGCAVGPEYTRPEVPTGRAFGATEAPPTQTRDVPGDWWTLFQHPALDALVTQALQRNATLEAARHAVRVAQETRQAQQAALWPQVQASYSPTRTKIAGNQGGNSPGVQGDGSVISTVSNPPKADGGTGPFNAPVIYNFHTAQVSVSYAPDAFGGTARQLQAADAWVDAQALEWQAARITLTANLVSAAILDAQLREQLRAAQAAADAAATALRLTQRLRAAGQVSPQDEANQRLAWLALQQAVPPLQQQREQNRNLMRNLIGAPQDFPLPEFVLDEFRPPQDLPSALPSSLLDQRPDVRAAEAQLQAAVAQIGVARAARLPQFTITGNAGGAAAHLSQAFLAGGRFFDLTATLTAPLFDAGAARHREQAASAAAAQAQAQYRATVLNALQNVADALRALDAGEATLHLALDTARTARQSEAQMRRRVDAGDLDRPTALAAEIGAQQADQQLATARAAQLINRVALYQALGGGWWQPTAPALPLSLTAARKD